MNIVVVKAIIRRLAEELLFLHGRILQAFLSPIITPVALLYRGVESSRAVKKVWYGLVGGVHMALIQMVLVAVAVATGLVMVRVWMEEPIVVQDTLHFDFREPNPVAVVRFESINMIPVGRNFHVSLLLSMPDSPYNRQLGVFQVSAELLSSRSKEGSVIVRSRSQACMLRFSSAPVRLARTLMMAMPLILGLTSETQQLHLPCLLKHIADDDEGKGGGGYEIRVRLSPRAGTSELPQLYDAQIMVKSEPPWSRDLVRRWKWTLSVWTSIYLYLALLVLLLSTFRTAFFTPFLLFIFMMPPSPTAAGGEVGVGGHHSGAPTPLSASEVIRRMQQRRRKNRTTASSLSTVTTAATKDDEEVASSQHPAYFDESLPQFS